MFCHDRGQTDAFWDRYVTCKATGWPRFPMVYNGRDCCAIVVPKGQQQVRSTEDQQRYRWDTAHRVANAPPLTALRTRHCYLRSSVVVAVGRILYWAFSRNVGNHPCIWKKLCNVMQVHQIGFAWSELSATNETLLIKILMAWWRNLA